MEDQTFQNIVLDLDFKIGSAADLPSSLVTDRHGLIFPEMLNQALVSYLDAWRKEKRLLPKQARDKRSSFVFRQPTAIDELDLVGTSFFATQFLFDHLGAKLPEGELSHHISCDAIVIEYLGYGCVRARIKYYLKVSAVALTLLGAAGGLVGGSVALKEHLDPPVAAIEASCSVHMTGAEDLGGELLKILHDYPETWHANGNEPCVRLRQQVLNQFLDAPIKDDGFYGGDTKDAEKAVAKKVGITGASINELYPFLAKRLEEPASILVFNIPRR